MLYGSLASAGESVRGGPLHLFAVLCNRLLANRKKSARLRRMKFLRFSAVACFLSCITLQAQQPPAPARPRPTSVIRNGGFERSFRNANLWAGVDASGNLAGFTARQRILDLSGNLTDADTPMPVSVAVGDLNGDKLPDIMAADPVGYIRIYFNSGSAQSPKFTHGELTLPFLALAEGTPLWSVGGSAFNQLWAKRRQVVRIGLWGSSPMDKPSIIAGNYFGEIFLIPNEGGTTAPRFSQPRSLLKASIPTMKDPNHRWGNVFAPLYYDWDGDNKPDLIVGEGSYSANNIHLFPNQGSAMAPVFNEEKRQALALGEGRMQLSPALADLDGDGKLDLLVVDRRGNLTAYLRPANWKPGDSISPSGYLAKNGGLTQEQSQAYTVGTGLATIATGDLNGDGLFDIVIGRSNGRIAWAQNKGTKESPKFDAPVDLKGTKPTPETWQNPSDWSISTGIPRGNFFAFATCVTAENDPASQPAEGKNALKIGYTPPINKIVPAPNINFPASPTFVQVMKKGSEISTSNDAETVALGAPSNFFVLRQFGVRFEIGKTYTLTFQVKGSKVSTAQGKIAWRGFKKLGEARIERGERGAAKKIENTISGYGDHIFTFNAGPNWSTVTQRVKIEFTEDKSKALNAEKYTSDGLLHIDFQLNARDGYLYIDNVKMEPAG